MSAKSNPLVGLLITVIGIGFAIWGALVVMEARSATNWPAVEGVIISSSVEHRVNTTSSGKGKWYYEARIKYDYNVDGVDYESKRVGFKSASYQYKSEVVPSTIVRRYPANRTVEVYYNPDDPEKAVLETEITFMTYIGLLIGAFLVVLGVILFMRSGNDE